MVLPVINTMSSKKPLGSDPREISNKKMQSNILMKFVSGGSNLVAAGFEISKLIAQHEKPLSDWGVY